MKKDSMPVEAASLGLFLSLGGFLFLVLISIGNLTTTELSRLGIYPVRIICLIGVAAVLVARYGKFTAGVFELISAAMLLLFYAFGLIGAVVNGVGNDDYYGNYMNILVLLAGVFLIGPIVNRGGFESYAIPYVLYVSAGMVLTLIVGGFTFDFPPRFVFEYASNQMNGDLVDYSQGMSQFFGLGGIVCMYLVASRQGTWKTAIFFMMGCVFLALSLFAGGRGDSLAAVLISFAYLCFKYKFRVLVPIISGLLFFYYFTDDLNYWLELFLVFQRMTVIGSGDYGLRDQLLVLAMNLLGESKTCLLIGCGFGYFQWHFGFEPGMYPHNFIAESFVVYGMPITLVLGFLCYLGFHLHFRQVKRYDLFAAMFFYSLLVALKSGGLLANWFFVTCVMYFASVGFASGFRASRREVESL